MHATVLHMTNSKRLLIILIILTVAAGAFYIGINQRAPARNEQNQQQEPDDSNIPSNNTEQPTPTPPSTNTTAAPKASPVPTTPPSSQIQNKGRVILTLTDDAVSINTIDSLFITFSTIAVLNNSNTWVSLGSNSLTYDLMQLRLSSKPEVMYDIFIGGGTYSQLQFTVSSVVVIKNGLAKTAKLPSSTVTIPLSVPITNGQISAIALDIIADKSLHITENGQYIFSPVLRVDTTSEIQTIQKSGSTVEFFGGYPRFSSIYGMIETGAIVKDSDGIDSLSRVELVDNIFVLIPYAIKRSDLTVTPKTAIDMALVGAHITNVSAVYAVVLDKKPAWLVSGYLNGNITNVYVNGSTGVVEKVTY
jgi:hypothetical protein